MVAEVLALGLVVNPYSAAIGAMLAAVVWTRSRSARGIFWGLVVLLATWILGEAALRLQFADEVARAGENGWLTFALASALNVGLGYVAPGWAGAFVGRRVTWGTGWLAAGTVALTAAGAAFAIGSSIAGRL